MALISCNGYSQNRDRYPNVNEYADFANNPTNSVRADALNWHARNVESLKTEIFETEVAGRKIMYRGDGMEILRKLPDARPADESGGSMSILAEHKYKLVS